MTRAGDALNWFVERLGSVFAILGTLALVAALAPFLILGTLARLVIVLLAVGVGCWVYAALEQPERTVETLSGRGVRYGSNSLVMSVAFIGILALVNVLANRYSTRADLTQNHFYTLSPLSVQVVKELNTPVQVFAFYQTGDPGLTTLQNLLREYVRQSGDKITYEFGDPQLKPGLARQYNVTSPSGTVVMVSNGKQQTVTGSDEASLTSALLKLERTKSEVVYYLTGHAELDFTSQAQDGASAAKDALTADNYDVKPLNLAASGKVPTDAAAIIVAGPTAALLPQEVTALEDYLDHGGKALFLVDKRQRANLEPIAERYGVQIGNGVVIDPQLSYQADPLSPVIQQYSVSPITSGLPELLFQAATSVSPVQTPPPGLQVQPIAYTTSQSWLNTDTKTIQYNPGTDPRGPLAVVTTVSKSATGTGQAQTATMRIVFVGNVAFATNPALQIAPGDKDLITNSVNWLTANTDLIQIPPKVPTDRTMMLSNIQLNVMLYGSVVFLPLLVLAVGGVVWWNRR